MSAASVSNCPRFSGERAYFHSLGRMGSPASSHWQGVLGISSRPAADWVFTAT